MRTVLVGAVESTRVALEGLVAHGSPPLALVTLPGGLAHRHSDWVDLAAVAPAFGVPVLETGDVNAPEVIARLRELRPEHILVVGWSQICRPPFLAVPSVGCVGYHPAPLPENRGRAVIPWTILQGRRSTGATLFWLDEGVDSGDILVQTRFDVVPDETARGLYDRHLAVLRDLLRRALPLLDSGQAPRLPQDPASATYCARRTARDGLVDWNKGAHSVWTLLRAVGDPYPGGFTFRRGERLTIWEAELVGPAPYWGLPGQVQAVSPEGAVVQCGDGEHVRLRTVEVGGARQPAGQVLRAHERLGVDWLDFVHALPGGGAG